MGDALEDDSGPGDEVDLANRQVERVYHMKIADKERKLLTQIDRALSKFDVPPNVLETITDTIERYGLVKLVPHPESPETLIRLEFASGFVAKLISNEPSLKELLEEDGREVRMPTSIKQSLSAP